MILSLLALAFGPLSSIAAEVQGVTTEMQLRAMPAKGVELRPETEELAKLVRATRWAQAEEKAAAIRRAFEAMFDPSLKQYVFQSPVEFGEFSKTTDVKFEWIDWGYKECLQFQAFLAVEKKDFAAAMALLKSIEAVAPVSAGTAAETGYVLGRLGRAEEGLAEYRHAFELSQRYESQRPYQGASLRGMGSALIDLQRWDDAERMFKQSLEFEPGNKVALNELSYIEQQRSK
ncbi:tetratricopeptide repeat protein [Ideonella azotifigens]|uniref:tetratricopeptide repeat protein n=1 Tax=Ideonella azotifigens TaxID=513160 RepID=UPI001476B248|nr:tetratricopeptide repeat protein [Ideonella azotifigens]